MPFLYSELWMQLHHKRIYLLSERNNQGSSVKCGSLRESLGRRREVLINLSVTFCSIQASSGCSESPPQETGAAGHGPATQTLAVQTPGQPLPHQDGEGPPGSGLAHDACPGK